MGMSYLKCAISGLAIKENELAYIVVTEKSQSEMSKIYKRDWYTAIGLPILGKYDDYGFVETSEKDLDLNKILIENANNKIFDKNYKVDLIKDKNLNNLWSAIVDNRFQKKQNNLNYTFISKKSVDNAIGLFPYDKPITEIDFIKKIEKAYKSIQDLKEIEVFLNNKKNKNFSSLLLLDCREINLLTNSEFNWIEKESLIKIIESKKNYDLLYRFFIITQILEAMGKGLNPPHYGTQDQNKINNQIKKFYKKLISSKGKK